MVLINDFTGVTLSTLNKAAFDMIRSGTQVASDYYPETLKICYITGAPFIFPALWSIIKNFIDEKTRNKVVILGSDF